jgi:hypothetical protein
LVIRGICCPTTSKFAIGTHIADSTSRTPDASNRNAPANVKRNTPARNYADVFSCRRTPGLPGKFREEDGEVLAREGPLKGLGYLGVMLLEAEEALFTDSEGTKVVGR